MITRQEKKKIFKEHSKFVYYIYGKQISRKLKISISQEEKDDVIQEGMLGLIQAINNFENEGEVGYDSPEFTSYVHKHIYGAMMKYYFRKSSVFKTTDTAFDKENIKKTMQLLKESFSMNMEISGVDGSTEELSNLIPSQSNDYEDMLFYTELERFLNLMPEEERKIMRYYYHVCIQLMDEKKAIIVVARHCGVSTSTIKRIKSEWNPELYEFLKGEGKGSIQDFHDSYSFDATQKLSSECSLKKHSSIKIQKGGKIISANTALIDEYIANGWQESSVVFSENKRQIWINNGKVAFMVRPSDVPKFKAIGFDEGRGKKGECIIKKVGKKFRVSNGEMVEEVYENSLEYWERIGYHVCEKFGNGTNGYVHIWKGTKITRVHKDDLQQYLDDGWKLGNGKILMCNLDGEKRKVLICEKEKYLSENWILVKTGVSAAHKISDPNMILINYNGLIEGYVEKNKLELFLSHGWRKGTAYITVYAPKAFHKSGEYTRTILSGKLQEYLDKGYTLDKVKE